MLSVHPSGFYAWIKEPLSLRAQEDQRQTKLLKKAWKDSGKVYGYRKIYDDLIDMGEIVSENRVARLARLAGIQAQIGYKKKPGVYGGKPSIVVDNTLDRQFSVDTPDRAWVTDITYYKIGDTYYYISMIMDLYSRKIIAFTVAESLHAKHSMKVLRVALKARQLPEEHQLIHHSDKGVQYTCNDYTKLLTKHQIAISMCNSVFENTNMERLNGIIKNDYLIHWAPKSFSHLKRLLTRAVTNYNNCPHGELDMMSPNQYEEYLSNVPLSQRTLQKVFTIKKSKNLVDPCQLELFNSKLFVNQKGQPNPV